MINDTKCMFQFDGDAMAFTSDTVNIRQYF